MSEPMEMSESARAAELLPLQNICAQVCPTLLYWVTVGLLGGIEHERGTGDVHGRDVGEIGVRQVARCSSDCHR